MSQVPMQYFNLMEENYSKYGLSVIQLIQIGKFYELWHEPDVPSLQGVYSQAELLAELSTFIQSKPSGLGVTPPIEQVASLLDMRIISPGKRSLLQMGFPIYSLTTHLSTLLDRGWTIIIIDELVTGKSTPKQRAISQVYSPSCNLEECLELSYVISIYFKDDLLGITLFSVMNGHSIMFPVYWVDRDKVARLLINYRIKEVIVWADSRADDDSRILSKIYDLLIGWNLFPSDPNAKIEVMQEPLTSMTTDLSCYLSYRYENDNKEWLLLHIYLGVNSIHKEWFNKNYQEYTLSKIFQSTWTEDVNQVNLISLLGVLKFIKDRNPNFIRNLQLPECYSSVVSPLNLILCNRAEYQLDLLPKKGKLGGLLNLIDYCSTAMGKRLLKFRLLNPITDYSELNLRYEEIATFTQLLDKQIFNNFELKQIKDLSSLHRQWAICVSSDTTLPPKKLSQIYHSYLSANKLIRSLLRTPLRLPPSIGPQLETCSVQLESLIEEIERFFQVDNLLGDFKEILQPIDNLTNLLTRQQTLKTLFTEWAEQTSNILGVSIKAEHFNKEGYAFSILSKGLAKLERYLANTSIILGKRGDHHIIITPAFLKVSTELSLLDEQINTYVRHTYNRELKRLNFSYYELFLPLENLISRLDVALSGAIVSIKFNYTKPYIVQSDQARGLIETTNIRHPLIEQLNTQEECVAHDISLKDRGMLIFSVNGAGKSTLLRAIGVNVILAQAGMYVAADSFKLRPYHYLITRILGGDDLHKGQGTFEVEMRDLSTILKLANYNSLILGDEICHGTEVSSGLAILAATIERLTAARTSFILSTHLHQVGSLIDSPVRCYHLSVIQRKGCLIYERKLKPGQGPPQYGIEVMGHIINDREFYNSALKYRQLLNWKLPPPLRGKSLSNSLTAFRPSKYNTQVFIDSCEICGAPAEAIHHIKPKSQSKSLYGRHNRRSNLVPVCSSCHLNVHRNKISILGWKKTPSHKKLCWVYIDEALDSGTE